MGEHPKYWDPLLISEIVEARNFKFGRLHNFGLGVPYQETTFRTKIGGVWTRGESQIFWDLLLISATIRAGNLKFGTQLGYGEYVTITTLVPNLVGAVSSKSTLKVAWTRYHIPATEM